MTRETDTTSSAPWIIDPERHRLGVGTPTRVSFPISPFAVQGVLPASEDGMTQLFLGIHAKWVEAGKIKPNPLDYQPYIFDLDFKGIDHVPPEVIKDVFPFCVGVLNGRLKPAYAVYTNLGEQSFADLHQGFGELGVVAVARQEGHETPTLIGLRRKIERYLDAYKTLYEAGQWVDGGPFSRAVLGVTHHSARLLNEMSRDGIAINLPNWSSNHSYFRAVA